VPFEVGDEAGVSGDFGVPSPGDGVLVEGGDVVELSWTSPASPDT
jgi:hypothetical protein